MLERPLTDGILRALNRLDDCRAVKIHSGAMQGAGLADITGCIHGQSFWLEVKRPGEPLPRLQAHDLQLWRDAGAIATVVRSIDDALLAINAVPSTHTPTHRGTHRCDSSTTP
jgi:hypothetical protein